jgi:pyridoxal phosphate-dependent aminotransferase EpsN
MALLVSLFFGFVPMFFFAALVYWLDRYEKEPKILLGATFFWGVVIAAGGTAGHVVPALAVAWFVGHLWMLVAAPERVARARHWATQARAPRAEYHHEELGYNYRLSNVLAAIGLGQLEVLAERVAARRAVFERYRAGLADLPGLAPMPEATYGTATRWLSCFLVDAAALGATRDDLLAALAAADVEARPVWKPMHLQPLYASCEVVGGAAGADLYARGICLPSSSSLAAGDQERVIRVIRGVARHDAP